VLTAIVIVMVIASLYFGREVFVPIALSILLSFALAPPVRWLRTIHVPRIAAVLLVVTMAFAFIAAFATIVAWQIGDLAAQLPSYQRNLETKIESFRQAPPGGGVFSRVTRVLEDLGRKIEEEQEPEPTPAEATGAPAAAEPIPVEIHEPDPTAMETLQTLVLPLVSPLATAGIVIVFVIFMLLKREDLRDRLIRLFGSRDLSRTTEAIDDAAHRVGHYLLMQLVVNVTYGLPVALGLWFIGVPNAALWGMLATLLRFVPYIGPIIAAFFPLALAIAVDPGWETLIWTGALLVVIELISNNAVEPWLYGASTGMSPVAIIAAAIFWTWLWGPIGLLLSTPLTVCLLVLGQHVPQLGFLNVLFGSDPVLTPAETLYQRMLVGDPDEATERAEDYLKEHTLAASTAKWRVAALAMAERDRTRGALDAERRGRLVESTMLLLKILADHEDGPPERPGEGSDETAPPAPTAEQIAPPPGRVTTDRLVSAPARAATWTRRPRRCWRSSWRGEGATTRTLPCDAIQATRIREVELGDPAVLVLSYMNTESLAHARFLVRRLRRRVPKARIVVGLWTYGPEDMARRDPLTATGADHVATSLADAVEDIVQTLSPGVADHRAETSEPDKGLEAEERPRLQLAAGE
jgi:predicted PurR-regulated permease PerM